MSQRDEARIKDREATVTATVRAARELRAEGLIARRISFGADGSMTVEIAGYQSPEAPTVDEQPRFRSYGEKFEVEGAAFAAGRAKNR